MKGLVHTIVEKVLLLLKGNLDEIVDSVKYRWSVVDDCKDENLDVIRGSIVVEFNIVIELAEKDSYGPAVSWNDSWDASIELGDENVK